MTPLPMEWLATLCLFFTLVHTLNAKHFEKRFHLLSEVEVIFGFWGIVYLLLCSIFVSVQATSAFLFHLNFSEAVFVIVIMITASTRPILLATQNGIEFIAKSLPLPSSIQSTKIPHLLSILTLAPLLGSLITEPAAMTVGAILLHQKILGKAPSKRLLYSTLATLFINVSIGGVLTSFAAPPVLMVARLWNWDTPFMFHHFGWKAVIAVILNAIYLCYLNREELKTAAEPEPFTPSSAHFPSLLMNGGFLLFTVLNAHHPLILIPGFAIFSGALFLTKRHQGEIRFQSSFFVGFFLAGLTILTAEQGWWLRPILQGLSEVTLFVGAIFLTAITDNAALTSLAAQVDGLSPLAQYFVVAGAVTGGGLTLIANAPNPAGYSILKNRFGKEGLQAGKLLAAALIPTLITGAFLWIH